MCDKNIGIHTKKYDTSYSQIKTSSIYTCSKECGFTNALTQNLNLRKKLSLK